MYGQKECLRHCFQTLKCTLLYSVRVWLTPSSGNSHPQQLWYVNVVPKATMVPMQSMGMFMGPMPMYGRHMMYYFPKFENVDSMLDKLNKRMAAEPLPGTCIRIFYIMWYWQHSTTSEYNSHSLINNVGILYFTWLLAGNAKKVQICCFKMSSIWKMYALKMVLVLKNYCKTKKKQF